MGTMYLMVPKVRQGGYIPFFVTERKRSEAALIPVSYTHLDVYKRQVEDPASTLS